MSQHDFKLPDLGEGTVESEIGEWFVSVGDIVEEESIICTMMTDKAAIELASPLSGRIVKLAGEPGDIVAVGAALVTFETDTAPAEAAPAESKPEALVEPIPAGAKNSRSRIIASPAIRRRAKEEGIDLTTLNGSGPGGRIQRKDFDDYLKSKIIASPASKPTTSDGVREIKVIGLRRIIAERMARAKQEIPHFAYVEEIDITELEALRNHRNAQRSDSAARLTLLPFLGVALIRALQDFPQCNATYDKERNILLQHDAVHLGIATQTPDGLKVPVIRHAENLDLDKLASEVQRISQRARDNSAKRDELSGSTITITSLGKLGGIASTPVINLPEVSIIGVNRAIERPVVLNGQITVRLMMNLSSSFDHRFVDGYDAAAMIQRIKELLEHPATIFLPD